MTASPAAGHWVHSWVAAPQLTEAENMPPAPFVRDGVVLADCTLRQTIRTSLGGRLVRLRFSNAFGGAPLPISAATIARPAGDKAGASEIEAGSSHPVTFGGRPGVTIPVGAQVVSDPVPIAVPAATNLTVSVYLAEGQSALAITSHPGSRTTSHLISGDHHAQVRLPGATPVAHWYFLSGLEVWGSPRSAAVVTLGDSLTDGRGSTTDGNDRWPDLLLQRLQAHTRTSDVAVLNQGAGGNRVLLDGLGPSALARLDRDVLALTGVAWLIVFHGINDIGTAEATKPAQQRAADDLIAAYEQMIVRAHAHGIRVYGATLAPFGGNAAYDDPGGCRESARQAVNSWIRTSHRFDSVIDFDAVVRDPTRPGHLLPAADEGDHLHLSPTGYRALAGAVPVSLFHR